MERPPLRLLQFGGTTLSERSSDGCYSILRIRRLRRTQARLVRLLRILCRIVFPEFGETQKWGKYSCLPERCGAETHGTHSQVILKSILTFRLLFYLTFDKFSEARLVDLGLDYVRMFK